MKNFLKNKRGKLSGLALGLVVAVVASFIGLYMISQVSSIFSVDPTSDFYSIYQSLTTKTSIIYDVNDFGHNILVIIVVVIVVALGVALQYLSEGQEGKETTASI